MKKVVLFSSLVFHFVIIFNASIFAQNHRPHQSDEPLKRAEILTKTLKDKLNLTDEQYSKVYAINLEAARKMEQYLSNGKHSDMAAKKAEVFQQQDDAFKNVLNPEQILIWNEIKQKRKSKNAIR